jgi:hypothetical protein
VLDSAEQDDYLAQHGFRPIATAPNPIDLDRLFFLRLGSGDYTVGYQNDDRCWLQALDHRPIVPTHFRPFPD